MVPENLLDSQISELPLGLAKMGYNYVDERCRRIVIGLEAETGYHADTTNLEELIQKKQELEQKDMNFIAKEKEYKTIFEQMEREMGEIIGLAFANKLGKKSVTLRDVLKFYLPKSIKIYNSDGFEISL